MILGQLATVAPTVEIWTSLYNLYNLLGIAAGVLVTSYLLFTVLKNRRKDVAIRHSEVAEDKVHWRKVLFTLAITSSVLFIVELQTFNSTSLIVPPQTADAIHIGVVGQQWSWTFIYPNGVRLVGNLTVPEGKTIILNLTSTDVTHSFAITGLDVAIDATPGRFNSLWFEAPSGTSSYVIRCKELCGVGHAFMTANLYVVDPATYDRWSAKGGS